MRRLIWFIVVATFAASSSYAQDISGDWQGSLKAGPQNLRIILKITRADSTEWKATMPAAKWRADIVPSDPPSDSLSHRGCRRKAGMGDILTAAGCLVRERVRSRPRNYSWAELLHRVFSIDVLECASCGGRLRIVAAIHPPETI